MTIYMIAHVADLVLRLAFPKWYKKHSKMIKWIKTALFLTPETSILGPISSILSKIL